MEETTMSQGDVPVNVMDIISGGETATESAAETNTEETDPSQEGEIDGDVENTPGEDENVPFHEHPRWKEVMDKNQGFEKQNVELKELVKKNDERYSSLEKALTALNDSKDGGLDPEYVKLMGDDDAAKDYYGYMQKLISDQVKQGIDGYKNSITEEETKAQQQRAEWETILDTQFKEATSTGFSGDRGELIEFAKTYSTGGVLMNLSHAAELMNKLSGNVAASVKESKKQNAAMVSSSTNSTPSSDEKVVTIEEMRKRPWSSWRD